MKRLQLFDATYGLKNFGRKKFLRISSVNVTKLQSTADLVAFIKEILHGNCSIAKVCPVEDLIRTVYGRFHLEISVAI